MEICRISFRLQHSSETRLNLFDYKRAVALGKFRSDCASDNIDTLIRLVWETPQGEIIECGSYRCGVSIAMAAASEYYNLNKTVYAFDTFGGLPYGEGVGFENFAQTDFVEIKAATAPYKQLRLVQEKHEDTVPHFSTFPISLLFMDSDHYNSHVVCLTKFWPMLVSGGYAVFHDADLPGVQQAIEEVIPQSERQKRGRFHFSPNLEYIVKP